MSSGLGHGDVGRSNIRPVWRKLAAEAEMGGLHVDREWFLRVLLREALHTPASVFSFVDAPFDEQSPPCADEIRNVCEMLVDMLLADPPQPQSTPDVWICLLHDRPGDDEHNFAGFVVLQEDPSCYFDASASWGIRRFGLSFYVVLKHRRKGIATKMANAALSWLSQREPQTEECLDCQVLLRVREANSPSVQVSKRICGHWGGYQSTSEQPGCVDFIIHLARPVSRFATAFAAIVIAHTMCTEDGDSTSTISRNCLPRTCSSVVIDGDLPGRPASDVRRQVLSIDVDPKGSMQGLVNQIMLGLDQKHAKPHAPCRDALSCPIETLKIFVGGVASQTSHSQPTVPGLFGEGTTDIPDYILAWGTEEAVRGGTIDQFGSQVTSAKTASQTAFKKLWRLDSGKATKSWGTVVAHTCRDHTLEHELIHAYTMDQFRKAVWDNEHEGLPYDVEFPWREDREHSTLSRSCLKQAIEFGTQSVRPVSRASGPDSTSSTPFRTVDSLVFDRCRQQPDKLCLMQRSSVCGASADPETVSLTYDQVHRCAQHLRELMLARAPAAPAAVTPVQDVDALQTTQFAAVNMVTGGCMMVLIELATIAAGGYFIPMVGLNEIACY